MLSQVVDHPTERRVWRMMTSTAKILSVRLDPLESLAALTDPIPAKGQHLVRTYSGYSNKKRGMRKKVSLRLTPEPANEADGEEVVDRSAPLGARAAAGPAPDDSSDDDFRKECRRTWPRMIKKIDEVDPLVCVRCGFPMRVLSSEPEPVTHRDCPAGRHRSGEGATIPVRKQPCRPRG